MPGTKPYRRALKRHRNVMASSKTLKPTIKSVASSVKKIYAQQELKHIDTRFITPVTQAGVFTCLNLSATGTTATSRIGNDIQATSIQFRGIITQPTDLLSPVIVRHIIFWDRQANAGTPTIATFFDLSVFSTAGDQIYAPYNENFNYRYRIVYDKTHTLTPQVASAWTDTGGSNIVDDILPTLKFSRKKRKLSRRVKYTADTAVIAAIETNALWSLWLTNSGTNLTPLCAYRFYFKDT